MPPTSFSSSAEDAIQRRLSFPPHSGVAALDHDIPRLEALYEVDWTASEIQRGSFKQVSLQFPDDLLPISVPIFQSLKKRLDDSVRLYVLADTSYGSCCVDEVAAQHVNSDVIVHYGYSCLSRPSRLPVIYVFSKADIDVLAAAEALLTLVRKKIPSTEDTEAEQNFILIPDVAYAYKADELNAAILNSPLLPKNSHVHYNHIPKRDYPLSQNPHSRTNAPDTPDVALSSSLGPASQGSSHRRYNLPPTVALGSCTILYVGPESLGLTNLLMTHPENEIISYDPTSIDRTAKVESVRTNKLLMRRYAAVQRARDADVFGILVGTLGVASYLPLISRIRSMLRAHHKKSYTLSVGKLNPSKLANFPEIECFVLVACPENSVIEAKEYLRPIVTPFELSLALSVATSWTGNYILDFERFIQHDANNPATPSKTLEGEETDQDGPIFSLVTGRYRHVKRYGEEAPLDSQDKSAVVLRNKDSSLAAHSWEDFLQQRTFRGLDRRLGEDAPSVLEEGRSGIAKGYQDDHDHDH